MNRFGNCKGLNHVIGYSRGLYHTVNERCLAFSYARHKGKHGKLYIVEEINKFRFREKKYELPVFFFYIPQTKIAKIIAKMTMRHSVR